MFSYWVHSKMDSSITFYDQNDDSGITQHLRYVDKNGLFNVVFNEVSDSIILISIDPDSDKPVITDINYYFEMITGHAFKNLQQKPLFDYLYKNAEHP
jgi:hypothetical protein